MHRCVLKGTIWALVDVYKYNCNGVQIRDPTRNDRRIGPPGTYDSEIHGIEFDIAKADFEDTQMVRLEPGQSFGTTYTFAIFNKPTRFRGSDVDKLVIGNDYIIALRAQRWRWMFEDDMPEGSTADERRLLLFERPLTHWKVDGRITFKCVE